MFTINFIFSHHSNYAIYSHDDDDDAFINKWIKLHPSKIIIAVWLENVSSTEYMQINIMILFNDLSFFKHLKLIIANDDAQKVNNCASARKSGKWNVSLFFHLFQLKSGQSIRNKTPILWFVICKKKIMIKIWFNQVMMIIFTKYCAIIILLE